MIGKEKSAEVGGSEREKREKAEMEPIDGIEGNGGKEGKGGDRENGGGIWIVCNGQERVVKPGSTVADLVAELGLLEQACAVEVNQQLVPKREHREKRLSEADRVEVVTLVGGG